MTSKLKSGFTLLELLVATAVSSIILLMVYSAYSSVIKAVDQGNIYAAYNERLLLALRTIDNDISSIYWKRNRKDLYIKSEITGESSIISFVSAQSRDRKIMVSKENATPYPDLVRIEYKVVSNSKTGKAELRRNEYIFTVEEDEKPVKREVLIPNLENIVFSFNQGIDWTKKWDSTDANKIPRFVKTEIKIKSPEDVLENYFFISAINIK